MARRQPGHFMVRILGADEHDVRAAGQGQAPPGETVHGSAAGAIPSFRFP
jgi:hypothetical protein